MDAKITARFYRVTPPAGARDFHELLLDEMQEPLVGNREKLLGEGVTLRLEHCDEEGGFIEGQLCRVQTVNVPPDADADGLMAIPLRGGLGHLAAFRYHPDSRVLVLQTNVQSATPNRLSLYVAGNNPAHIFAFEPILSEDAWARFREKRPRAFTVRFAGIEQLEGLEQEGVAVAQGVRMMAEAYEGVQVTVEISVGRSRRLSLDPRRVLQDLGRIIGAGVADKATAKVEGEGPPIDLLHEQLKAVEDLDFSQNDPDANYEIRKAFLRRAFVSNSEALRRFGFGA